LHLSLPANKFLVIRCPLPDPLGSLEGE